MTDPWRPRGLAYWLAEAAHILLLPLWLAVLIAWLLVTPVGLGLGWLLDQWYRATHDLGNARYLRKRRAEMR